MERYLVALTEVNCKSPGKNPAIQNPRLTSLINDSTIERTLKRKRLSIEARQEKLADSATSELVDIARSSATQIDWRNSNNAKRLVRHEEVRAAQSKLDADKLDDVS